MSKFMISQTGQEINAGHKLFNISKSKGNQAIALGHLKEYNIRNIFLENSYRKCAGEASPRPFCKKLKLNVSVD